MHNKSPHSSLLSLKITGGGTWVPVGPPFSLLLSTLKAGSRVAKSLLKLPVDFFAKNSLTITQQQENSFESNMPWNIICKNRENCAIYKVNNLQLLNIACWNLFRNCIIKWENCDLGNLVRVVLLPWLTELCHPSPLPAPCHPVTDESGAKCDFIFCITVSPKHDFFYSHYSNISYVLHHDNEGNQCSVYNNTNFESLQLVSCFGQLICLCLYILISLILDRCRYK